MEEPQLTSNKKLKIIIAAVIGLIFGFCLLLYIQPMEDLSVNLSLLLADGQEPEDYDSKGWRVYTQEGDVITELEPDGIGGFTGLELGQTYYCSRILEEELDSPTLQIAPVDRSFAVWLDNDLIYTDCPELDNQIGSLTLPMFDWFREESIHISLPSNYRGKTLTIAQSFSEFTETASVKAHPSDVVLYCGYAYESALISESFRTAVIETLIFAAGCILLYTFVRNGDWSMLCLALVAFLEMVQQMTGTSYFLRYFQTTDNSPIALIPLVSSGFLLVYLTLRGGSCKKVLWIILAVYGIAVCADALSLICFPVFTEHWTPIYSVVDRLAYWSAFCGMITVLVLGVWKWSRERSFYRMFIPLALCGIAVHWIGTVLQYGSDHVATQVMIMITNRQITYAYTKVMPALTTAAILTAVTETARMELDRRTEERLMESRLQMARESYETIRHQHEEVMMIRHDMIRHFLTLRGISDRSRAMEYIDTIIGQNEAITPVVRSGNEMLDIILNSRLGLARESGIRVNVIRAKAPSNLPIQDADLCSLVMNMVDNAIEGVRRSGSESPVIGLDIHTKNGYFVFICENSAADGEYIREGKNQTVPKHGLGLKIIRKVAANYQGMTDMEFENGVFRVRMVIPMG